MIKDKIREGNLEAPTRHALDWKNPDFVNPDSLNSELERVFDLCHGCRRCVSLCNSFPTLFDLVDESPTMEMDGVDKTDFWKVVDQCYLCDLCYQTKCPYIPPHEWNIDFPHLMLRAKATKFQQGRVTPSEKILSSTDMVGKLAGIPVVVNAVNAANRTKPVRKVLDKVLGVHPDASIPAYHSKTFRKMMDSDTPDSDIDATVTEITRGKVAIFATCYGNYNAPDLGEDLVKVLRHNRIPVTLVKSEQCCGMPKLELGDLDSVAKAKEANIPQLVAMVNAGWDIMAPVPSCTLMFRQELPLMFPQDEDVQKVAKAIYDPFEYLMLRHKEGMLCTDFKHPLGKVAYHVACHQRVQKIGLKTKECLQLIPDTEVMAIERCSGHDGTYGVKSKFYEAARKIVRPVVKKVEQAQADHYGSDCPMAGKFIEHALNDGSTTDHPISLLRKAYNI
jgi:Fe-S oxidoreductase